MGVGRLVLCALPFQGHMSPLLQLGTLLRPFFSVTILHSSALRAPEVDSDDFDLVPMSEPPVEREGCSPSDDIMTYTVALNAALEAPFRRRLAEVVSSAGEQVCLVCDVAMFSVRDAAEELSVPLIALRTSGAACFNIYASFPLLRDKYPPFPSLPRDQQSNAPVTEIPPFRVRDLPNFEMCSPESTYEVVTQCVEHAKAAKALILNTFESLESVDILKLQEDLGIPIFPIGPLHKLSPDTQSSLLTQDLTCIDWLDHMVPESVLYVSFGSLACMTEEELLETAWGLANSQQPFLWVLRPGSVKGYAGAVQLPEDFLAEVGKRGRVVEWAPQQEVLRNRAIGGFWTHCGWNSTLESICEGVPMLCWPYFGDQMVNTRVLDHVWKVGIEMEKVLKRDEIESAVRRLMVGEEGREMRKKARIMKTDADLCTKEGGSSYLHLEKLVQLILSMK